MRMILDIMAAKYEVYDYEIIQDGFKVLNTIAHMYRLNQHAPEERWDAYQEGLTNIIAVENTLEWIEKYNSDKQSYNEKYGKKVSTLDFSCYLKECNETDLGKAFGDTNDEIEKRRDDARRRRAFHEEYVTDYRFNDGDGIGFMRAYRKHFDQYGQHHIRGGMWKTLVPGEIDHFMGTCNIYYQQEHYTTMNIPFRVGTNDLLNVHFSTFLDLAGALLFPSKIQQDITVYRIDHQRQADRVFKTLGYYSTSLSYDTSKQFDDSETNAQMDNGNKYTRILKITIPRGTYFIPLFKCENREKEITLMPGTTLTRNESCEREEISSGIIYKVCEYTVTRTVDLSDDIRGRIFSRLQSLISKHPISNTLDSPEENKKLVRDIVKAYR